MKQRIKLTEGDLHRIVKESVKRVLKEIGNTTKGQYMLGRLYGRTSDDDIKKYAANRRREQNFGYDGTPFEYVDGTNSNPMGQEFFDGITDYRLGHSVPPKHSAVSTTSQGAPFMDGTDDSERQNAKYHMDGDKERWGRERSRDGYRY